MSRRLTDEERAELLARADAEIKAARGRTITVNFSFPQAMWMLRTLQLALRHPQTSRLMRDIAKLLEWQLGECGEATKKLCALGWDPEQDTE